MELREFNRATQDPVHSDQFPVVGPIGLTFSEYQQATGKTAIYPKDRALDYLVPGLAAEVGELSGLWAKAIRDEGNYWSPERTAKLRKEVGDCMWFLSEICTSMCFNMELVAAENLDKLRSRQSRGVLGGDGDNR